MITHQRLEVVTPTTEKCLNEQQKSKNQKKTALVFFKEDYQNRFGLNFTQRYVLSYCYKVTRFIIGVGSGAAGAALVAPIFCLVAVLGPRFFTIR